MKVEREPRGIYTYHITLVGDEAQALYQFIDGNITTCGGHMQNLRRALLDQCPDQLRRSW